MAPKRRLDYLMSQGLTENQARAYLGLLDFASATVSELSRSADLPRNRLYEVLRDLEGLGLAEIELESPRRYRARPLTHYMERRAEELVLAAREIKEGLDEVAALFTPPPAGKEYPTSGRTRVIMSRRAVAREIDRFFQEAEEHLLVMASVDGVDRAIRYVKTGTKRRRDDDASDVRVEGVVPVAAHGGARLSDAEHLFTGGLHVLEVDTRLTVFVRDHREGLLVQAIPEDDRLRVGDDFALLTTNPAILHDITALLRMSATESAHPT